MSDGAKTAVNEIPFRLNTSERTSQRVEARALSSLKDNAIAIRRLKRLIDAGRNVVNKSHCVR